MKVGADIFKLLGQSYLLLVDNLTKYPKVLNLSDKTAYTVIQKMKSVFARHGIPREIVSDLIPFASYEMKAFAASWEFKLTHSSPGFPSSNGMATQTGTDPHLVLLSLRNTPVTGLSDFTEHTPTFQYRAETVSQHHSMFMPAKSNTTTSGQSHCQC